MSRIPRRTFLKQTAAATLAGLSVSSGRAEHGSSKMVAANALPWYRRTLRWGQTNITEIDPAAYDIAWWRQHWKRTGHRATPSRRPPDDHADANAMALTRLGYLIKKG